MIELGGAEKLIVAVGIAIALLAPVFALATAARVPQVLRSRGDLRALLRPMALGVAALFIGGGLIQMTLGRGEFVIYSWIGAMNLAIGVAVIIAVHRKVLG